MAANLTAMYVSSDEDTAAVSEARGRAFSASTVALLRAFHQKGMVGTGRDHSSVISEAAHETSLTEDQVKVSNCRLRSSKANVIFKLVEKIRVSLLNLQCMEE